MHFISAPALHTMPCIQSVHLLLQVVKFLDVFPDSANAYWYVVYSLGGGILLGLGLYGWAVWA